MRTIRFLLQKEFRQIFRNKSILPMIFIMPIIQLLIVPLAADFEIKNINISIVDHDRSTYSRQLIDKVIASGYFMMNDYGASFDVAYEQFQQDRSDLVLEIPKDFEQDIVTRGSASLLVAVNAINGAKASVGNAYLNQIIRHFDAHVRIRHAPVPNAAGGARIAITSRNRFNQLLDYPSFMVPGLLVILVTMVGAYMCAVNIVKEKEVGTIEQINVTPIRKLHFILGKMIPFLVIGVFIFTIGLFGVAWLVYRIVPVGSLGLIYLFLVVYLIAVLGIGLVISTYSDTQQQAMSLAFFFMMIFILMSGLFTSADSMPGWARMLSQATPTTHFVEVMRLVVLKGSKFSDISRQFIIVSVCAVIFNTWAALNYRKTN